MTKFIISQACDSGDDIQCYRTDASLLRVQRYCRAMEYELVAYGDMQTFGDEKILTSRDMTLGVHRLAKAERKRRRRPKDGILHVQSLDGLLGKIVYG